MKISLKEVLMASSAPKLKLIKVCDFVIGGALAWLVPAKKRPAPEAILIKRLLIIRPGGIGDAVFVLPFLKRLREKRPSLQIDVLCERRNSSVFSSQQSLCDRIYLYDNPASLFSVFRNQYDVAIDTEQWHYLSALAVYFCRAQYTLGFGSRPLRKKLFDATISYGVDTYELESFQKLFLPLFPEAGTVESLENAFHPVEDQLPPEAAHIPPNNVAFFPGGSLPQKQLNIDQTVQVIKFLIAAHYHVVLLGGEDYLSLSQQVSQKINAGRLINLVAQTSFLATAAVIKRAKLFVGTDSGLLHLACALGVPTISIFGSSNRRKWGPHGEKNIVLSDDVSCSPCTHFSYSLPICQGTYFCMNKFDVNKICNAISSKLETN